MPLSSGKGYRTFAITGQKVQLSSGSVPNLSRMFYGDDNATATTATMVQQKNRANQGSFYQTPDDIRKAVQKYMSASASDITRLNDTQITNLSLLHRSSSSNGGFSSRSSSRAGSPAPSRHLELSIRVSTPDESNGKMPPIGRGRPNSPNISMIRGPKLSVFYFNDDFTFDESSSQAQIAENMFNDLTISSTLDQTSNITDNDFDDKTPMNSSNSDGGYVSSELSDNTIHDSPKIDMKRIQEARRELSDQNNNNAAKANKVHGNLNEKKLEVQTNDSFSINLYRTQGVFPTNTQHDSENNGTQFDNLQRTVSKKSDDVFTENTADDETMRFSELKLSEASSMASTLHNDDLESNISYDTRINDTMGIPMVSTLKRQDGHGKSINASALNDKTITQDDGLLPVRGNKETCEQSPRKPDIPENKNWTQERSSSFSGFTQLERLREHSNRSYRDLNRIRGEHSYVKRNDSFVKSIENVSPWKGSWTARNVTFDETGNKRFSIESRQELQRQQQYDTKTDQPSSSHRQNKTHHGKQKYKQTRQPNHCGSLDVRKFNRNQRQEMPYQMRVSMPQKSNLARHLHNTSLPSGKVSNQAWKRYSSPPSLEPHFSAYNRSQEEGETFEVSQASNLGQASRNQITHSQNQTAANYPPNDFNSAHNYNQAVPRDCKYSTLPRNFGGQHQNQSNVQQKERDFAKQRKAQLQEFLDPRLAYGMPNENQKNVRQYYAQFYDQNQNKPVNPQRAIPHNYHPGRPFQKYPSQAKGMHQNHGHSTQQTCQTQNQRQQPRQVRRNTSSSSNRSISSSSYSNSTSSSPVRSPGSPTYTTSYVSVPERGISIYNQNSNKNRSARRKLQLSDYDGEDEGGFKQHQLTRTDGRTRKQINDEEVEVERIPRHPAINTIQESHRWVGR